MRGATRTALLTIVTLMFCRAADASGEATSLAPIDYWDDEFAAPIAEKEQREEQRWAPFLDPDRLEFWQEGSYTPPLPLIWAMRDPSKANIQRYLSYLTKRAAVHERFQRTLAVLRLSDIVHATVAFRTDCMACHAFLQELAGSGLDAKRITLLQVDAAPTPPVPWSVRRLSRAETQRLRVETVPVAWVERAGAETVRLDNPSDLFQSSSNQPFAGVMP